MHCLRSVRVLHHQRGCSFTSTFSCPTLTGITCFFNFGALTSTPAPASPSHFPSVAIGQKLFSNRGHVCLCHLVLLTLWSLRRSRSVHLTCQPRDSICMLSACPLFGSLFLWCNHHQALRFTPPIGCQWSSIKWSVSSRRCDQFPVLVFSMLFFAKWRIWGIC